MRSRILVVTTSYPAFDGDPAGHFVEAEVRELERAGHAVTVVTPDATGRSGSAFGWPGVATRIRENPWRAPSAAAWVLRAALAVRNAAPQRIIAHWSVPSAFPIALASDAELEVVSHGGDVRLLCRMPRSARSAIVSRIAERATRWRFVSESLLAELAMSLPDAAALHRVAVLGASPLGMIDVRDAARARREGIGARRLYVCAGRLVASKRVDKVIDYVASSREKTPPVLVVLGDGPERAHLEHLAQRWQLDARFLGTTPRREALTWIGAADEVVHASTAEGLSTVVREAEHFGIPVTILQ